MKILGIQKIKDEKVRKSHEQTINAMITSHLHDTDEYSVVANPHGIFPPYEIYPLGKVKEKNIKKIRAFLTDMDGTTTTTEALCLHSLEYMVKAITHDGIKNLDHTKDYPHIIGNSTTKHVEYLLHTYGHLLHHKSFVDNYIFATLWTLSKSPDTNRKADAKNSLQALGIFAAIEKYVKGKKTDEELRTIAHIEATNLISESLYKENLSLIVKMAVEVYYQRYHELLIMIRTGHSQEVSATLLGGKRPIEPMKGIALFLSLIKGLLGEEIIKVPELKDASNKETLRALGTYFEKHPAKVAVVTSSIFYEADIVLSEVFTIIQEQIRSWPISEKRKKIVLKTFSQYTSFYDGVVTASDSNEIRLKPHRDLYSIALHKLGIQMAEFENVIGLEDSESGLLAIRSSGIGRAVGVPFDATAGHNLEAAYVVMKNGLVELIERHNLFLIKK